MATGSFTPTITDLGRGLTKVSIAWTASAGGAVNGASFPMPAGRIIQAKFVSVQTGYTATLVDVDGIDLLMGKGASLSANAIVVPVVSSVSPAYNDPTLGSPPGSVTPTITGGGAAGTGRIDLIVGP
jgi:hypothetical protein